MSALGARKEDPAVAREVREFLGVAGCTLACIHDEGGGLILCDKSELSGYGPTRRLWAAIRREQQPALQEAPGFDAINMPALGFEVACLQPQESTRAPATP